MNTLLLCIVTISIHSGSLILAAEDDNGDIGSGDYGQPKVSSYEFPDIEIPHVKKVIPIIHESQQQRKRVFSGGSDVSYKKPMSKLIIDTPQSDEAVMSSRYRGGCDDPPQPPMNSAMKCSAYSGCRANCKEGYLFPNGQSKQYISCVDGKWEVKGSDWNTIPHCEPICSPPCLNKGICIAPNKCNCFGDFEGPQCQFQKNKKCEGFPVLPPNSDIKCTDRKCRIQCLSGYKLNVNVSKLEYKCEDGFWVPGNFDITSNPTCEATCKQPCLNGGKCISHDSCQCPLDFRGPQCQYSIANCAPEKSLHFGGGYQCKGVGDKMTCQISCPQGMNFQFEPAANYSCDYSIGRYMPQPIPNCINNQESYQLDFSNSDDHIKNDFTVEDNPMSSHFKTEKSIPAGKTCSSWSGSHFRSFDGLLHSFQSTCSYVLAKDSSFNYFEIIISLSSKCMISPCISKIEVKVEKDVMVFRNIKIINNGSFIINGEEKSFPFVTSGILIEKLHDFIMLEVPSIGLVLQWNSNNIISVTLGSKLWSKTVGLCGNMDGDLSNDMMLPDGSVTHNRKSFVAAWQVPNLEDECDNNIADEDACLSVPASKRADGQRLCQALLSSQFDECSNKVDHIPFYHACQWDYCTCFKQNRTNCGCSSLAAFVDQCQHEGVVFQSSWRDNDFCPFECPAGRIYQSCLKSNTEMCGSVTDNGDLEYCIEGCTCPEGLVLHEGKCILKDLCPCYHHNNVYASGETVIDDCNTCTCEKSQWVCTNIKCGARCSIMGDPHYITFDGRQFDFMGKCSYYLLKSQNFSIVAENTACAGSISEEMKFPVSLSSGFPSCTKSVIIIEGETVIKLKQNREVTINGKELNTIPTFVKDIYIKKSSSIFINVILSNKIEIWWDGLTRAYIDVPGNFHGYPMKGLCGTYNSIEEDDFITPEGDIESMATAFANKWKVDEECPNIEESSNEHPCDMFPTSKKKALEICGKLKGKLFRDCHYSIDPDKFYQDCIFDMCTCQTLKQDCMCSSLASYSKACSKKGVYIDWRHKVRECGISCPRDQIYKICGDSCLRSCFDISLQSHCKKQCVEGCNCPDGFSLNPNNECVPISHCPCVRDGKLYSANETILQSSSENEHLCTCVNALWECKIPRNEELIAFRSTRPVALNNCDSSKHMEFTTCEPPEPLTCHNMHEFQPSSSAICQSGCQCEKGYVYNSDNGSCVLPSDCPCHHGHRSYSDGETIQESCNTCTCGDGAWHCSDHVCPGLCSVWGDSHYKTFDGKIYDFFGDCDYMLSKGKASKVDTFEIIVQNVPCGSGGVTCSKSVTLKVGSKSDLETIHLIRGQKLGFYKQYKRITVREAGYFVFVEVDDLGLVLQWDRGTSIYIRIDPKWKGKLSGLCGNYNDHQEDDFKTPSGGISEALPQLFGDSWKVQKYCPAVSTIQEPCVLNAHRKAWAFDKCKILKSSIFQPCHSEVDVQPYMERCVFDTCACDMGGDCECLCTAISAYAYQCNLMGVPVKWRTQDLCPMQCDGDCAHYTPCMSTCPFRNCDNMYIVNNIGKTCTQDSCIEGCQPKTCPEGQIYRSSSDLTCVPETTCKTVCLVSDSGVVYYEGDIMESDDCHICYCSRHEKLCQGVPCQSTTVTYVELSTKLAQTVNTGTCHSGWSEWINQNHPIIYKKPDDIESLDSLNFLCPRENIVDIQCRTVLTHYSSSATGQDVECSLDKGLICRAGSIGGNNMCFDYEIKVLCNCGGELATTTPKTGIEKAPIPRIACKSGWTTWMNSSKPSSAGEFETPFNLRTAYSFCPDHQIVDVECRNTVSGKVMENSETEYAQCTKVTGFFCQNAGGSICDDFEVRFNCECRCDDGLGMENGLIKSNQISVSSFLTPGTLGDKARLNGKGSWTPDENYKDEDYIQVDLLKLREVTGIITQGNAINNQWVSTFFISWSPDGKDWYQILKPGSLQPKEFEGNFDGMTEVENLFPEPLLARIIKIIPIKYHGKKSLRFELLGCDTLEVTTEAFARKKSTVCGTSHWTNYMNSHTPAPGDWDEIENIESLRTKYGFCSDDHITKIRCRTAQTHLNYNEPQQLGVTCNLNSGLQCNDYLQGAEHCMDYEVAFYCDCFEDEAQHKAEAFICDPAHPNQEHPVDCSLFYHCQSMGNETKLIEKSCGLYMYYNPKTMICDWPANVVAIKPECGGVKSSTVPSIQLTISSTTPVLPETRTVVTKEMPIVHEGCTENWTEWINISHPGTDGGDYELLDDVVAEGKIALCPLNEIIAIECKFEKQKHKGDGIIELADYTESGDFGVTCKKTYGLVCNNRMQTSGQCQDYKIRVLCQCPTTTPKSTFVPSITEKCAVGNWHSCAFKCNELCHFFYHRMKSIGYCVADDSCIPGCIEPEKSCPSTYLWRDEETCVKEQDCTCLSNNGTALFPGAVYQSSHCVDCQCLKNKISCEDHCEKTSEHIETFTEVQGAIATGMQTSSCGWTSWFSKSTPKYGDGEFENLELLKRTEPTVCSNPTAINCRDVKSLKDYTQTGQVVFCDLKNGLRCAHIDNRKDKRCFDYEIRYYCPCENQTTQASVVTSKPTISTALPNTVQTTTVVSMELFVCGWTPWISNDSPKYGHGDIEDIQFLKRTVPTMCSNPSAINCREIKSLKNLTQTGQIASCDLKRGFVCVHVDNGGKCLDYEVRYYCPCENRTTEASVITSEPLISTTESYKCGWGPWLSNDNPRDDGDIETLINYKATFSPICNEPTAIECRSSTDKLGKLKQNLTCNETFGLTCYNNKNSGGCEDYEIRFYCPCGNGTATATTMRTPKSTVETNIGVIHTPPPCDGWSEWVNDHSPDSNGNEYEYVSLKRFQSEGFCLQGSLSNVECRDATTHENLSYQNSSCSIINGLNCQKSQPGIPGCRDHEIRYYCSCGISTVTPKGPIPSVEEKISLATTVKAIIVPHSTTSLPLCDDSRLTSETARLKDHQFSATSSLSQEYTPEKARWTSTGWVAGSQDLFQYLQIDLGKALLVYGVRLKGHVNMPFFVTEHFIMYGEDGIRFSYIVDENNSPKLLRGPQSESSEAKIIFPGPLYARFLRIVPQKWVNKISLRLDVLGCGTLPFSSSTPATHSTSTGTYIVTTTPYLVSKETFQTTTEIITTHPWAPPCQDEMGVGNGLMNLNQISVSSVYKSDKRFGPSRIALNTPENFGGSGGWIADIDNDQQFVMFDLLEPRNLTGIKSQGVEGRQIWVKTYSIQYSENGKTWNDFLDANGFPLIFAANTDEKTTVTSYFGRVIRCRFLKVNVKSWSKHVGMRLELLGCFSPYSTTATPIQTVPSSSPSIKSNCSVCPGLIILETLKNCPCSGVKYWNGSSCVAYSECGCYLDFKTIKVGTLYQTEDCSECVCELGGKSSCSEKICNKCGENEKAVLTSSCSCVCKPCPVGTKLCPTSNKCLEDKYWCDGAEDCPDDEKNCIVSPTTTVVNKQDHEPEKVFVCDISGNDIKTFDDVKFIYEYCSVFLAVDIVDKNWNVSAGKQCEGGSCHIYITVNQDEHSLVLKSDFTVNYEDYDYTIEQSRKLGSKYKAFVITRLGNTLHFESHRYGFWFSWNMKSDIKIGVSSKLTNQVSGLCGYFNKRPDDDFSKSNGELTNELDDFVSSWAVTNETCIHNVCSVENQETAWKICSLLRTDFFSECLNVVDMNKYVSSCMENVCTCLKEKDEQICKCDALLEFTLTCQMEEPSIDLSHWRVANDCPASCPPGLVFRDCSHQQCELTCDSLDQDANCPSIPDVCYSGCFCPEGLVRKDDQCVPPINCRDCVCDGFGDPQYRTFDRSNYTFNGNCTYVAARDVSVSGEHQFEVLVTNKACIEEPSTTCTYGITILFEGHIIQVKRAEKRKLNVLVDKDPVNTYPLDIGWAHLELIGKNDINILIPAIQLEVSYFYHNFGFIIRVPSSVFHNKTEGLCGNCNKDPSDDLTENSSDIPTEDIDKFGMSWLATDDIGLFSSDNCGTKVLKACVNIATKNDSCNKLLDKTTFGPCHALEDPAPYVSSCHFDVCHSSNPEASACRNLEQYAKRCMEHGICIDWREKLSCPYPCPMNMIYKQCATGCQETCQSFLTLSPEVLALNIDEKSAGDQVMSHDLSQSHKPSDTCEMSLHAGCYCPDNQVLKNGTCVHVKQCYVCDDHGHSIGDEWAEDICTKCECTDKGSKCTKQMCQDPPQCKLGHDLKTSQTNACCPKYECVPNPTTTSKPCPVAASLECGFGQVKKYITEGVNCPVYVCECLLKEDCPQLDYPQKTDLGEVTFVNSTGCCPRVEVLCDKNLCPANPGCQRYYQSKLVKKGCCDVEECHPPFNKCIFKPTFGIDNDGRQIILQDRDNHTSLLNVGDKVRDGLCKNCSCLAVGEKTQPQIECFETTCNTPANLEKDKYELVEKFVAGTCCPVMYRVNCKENNTVYKEGQTWKPKNDPCKKASCVRDKTNVLSLRVETITCDLTKCPLGYKLVKNESSCCGTCKQYACVDGEELRLPGTSWKSLDHCTEYHCVVNKNQTFQIESAVTLCNTPDESDLEHFVLETITEPGKCCPLYKRKACLDREGSSNKTYMVNETWSSNLNPCDSFECRLQDGEAIKLVARQECFVNCQKGWQYLEPASGQCCGECVQTMCVSEDEMRKVGETWYSDDKCWSNSCEKVGDEVQIVSVKAECPPFPNDCPPENTSYDETGCCKLCNVTGESYKNCNPEPVTTSTLGQFHIHSESHGLCENKYEVKGFTQCSGHCESHTIYDPVKRIHSNLCKCCQIIKTEDIEVNLTCADGTELTRLFPKPSQCSCGICSALKVEDFDQFHLPQNIV